MTTLALPGSAFAAGGRPAGHGNGGGETETATNNLSVPTIFVGSSASFGLTNPALQPPAGTETPLTGYPLNPTGYYYVQGVNHWQAPYQLLSTASADLAWGDNLAGGTAAVQVNHPVRVEVGLTTDKVTMDGYYVQKLDPNALDRESAYGTLATLTAGTYSATAVSFPYTPAGATASIDPRVFGGPTTLTITGPVDSSVTMSGEINATGAPVYGYNWTPKAAGKYTLTFAVPSGITLNSGSATINVVVTSSRGGGGGGHHR